MTRILLVEDEESYRDPLTYQLEREGFDVVTAATGPEALSRFEELGADLVLLDLMLPGLPGTEVCRRLRLVSDVPVIMLTAKDDEIDKVVGLELGADDYVTKPFSPRELVARVKAVLRRTAATAPETEPALRLGGLTVDPARREVTMDDRRVQLTAREFDLLAHLVRNRGIVLTRSAIMEQVWGWRYGGDSRTVDVHIRQVRAKLGDGAPIRTVRGVGYKADDRP